MTDRIDYRALAAHLSALDVHADCVALYCRLLEYPGAERLAAAVLRGAESGESWMRGLAVVSAALQAENVRFDRGMFEEWCVDGH